LILSRGGEGGRGGEGEGGGALSLEINFLKHRKPDDSFNFQKQKKKETNKKK
jgi:hypothetical protein